MTSSSGNIHKGKHICLDPQPKCVSLLQALYPPLVSISLILKEVGMDEDGDAPSTASYNTLGVEFEH